MLSFVDRILLSLLVGPIKADLGLSDTQIALVNGLAFSMFYATIGLPLGWLTDRVSRRGIIAAGIALWSLFTAASGMVRNFGQLFTARMGVGVGEAALSPAAYSLIADYFRPAQRGRAIAIYTLGVSLGSSLAYLIGGMLIGFAKGRTGIELPLLGTVAPWRFVFIAVGLPGVLMGLLVLTIREPARREVLSLPGAGKPEGLWALIRSRPGVTAAYMFGYGCINIPFAGFLAWGPTFLMRRYGLSPAEMGISLALVFLIPTTIGQLAGAAISDRNFARGRRDAPFTTALYCAVLLIPAAILMPLAPTWQWSIGGLAVIVLLVCGSVGHSAVMASLIAPNRLRGQFAACFFLVQNVIGQAITALLIAVVTDHVFHDEARIGDAMAIVGGIGATIGAVALALGRAPLRRLLADTAPTRV